MILTAWQMQKSTDGCSWSRMRYSRHDIDCLADAEKHRLMQLEQDEVQQT